MNHGLCHESMSLPDAPAPPRFLLTNTERAVLIDTEGGVCLLHPERFKAIDPISHPFPGVITNAVLMDNNLLISTWVEREISLARLAALDLNEPLQDGIALPDLRVAYENDKINHHHVAGSVWSHILDAEPLALCKFENDLIFCTHHRGLYRVTSNSDEVWRRKPLEWDSLVQLPDGEVLVELVTKGDSVWAFSLGGGWAEIDASDGSVRRKGVIKFQSKINRVWVGDSDEWLFGLSHNRMARWVPNHDEIQVENTQGPIQDAIWVDGSWLITGWREDLQWKQDESQSNDFVMTSMERSEIGHRIINRGEDGYWVLDNRGQWTPFAME
tara:strand:+ start:853 stop:1836 length:984 start_codon:yes stop_codon:yes gene_type:complete